jgi:CubicO group peptidase (beta-lactamase class C family)
MNAEWTNGVDQLLEGAVASGAVPAAAAIVVDRDGVLHQSQAGLLSDTVWRYASMTKSLTSVAALQLFEEGKLDLDAEVASIIPAFGDLQVLDGFDGDEPRLRPPARQATVRELFVHTAGHGYAFGNEDLVRYHAVTGVPDIFTGLEACLHTPLVHDPGTAFQYGINVDWLGRVVEALDDRDLEASLRARVFDPLGMDDATFRPSDEQRARMIPVHHRLPDGGLMAGDVDLPRDPEFCSGGGGLHGTAGDYGRFMRAMLNDGQLDGVRILRPETAELAFTDNLAPVPYPERMESAIPELTNVIESLPVAQGYGLGLQLVLEDIEGMRRAGTGSWAGLFNCYYWIDRTSGVAGAFFTQVLPFFDARIVETAFGVEGAVYAGLPVSAPAP